MFDIKQYNSKGIYSIRFYELGVPISIVIDDYLPIYPPWLDNYFAWTYKNPAKELWPILLEKAYGKLNGGYGGLAWGGNP